jgi:hypothetical protein
MNAPFDVRHEALVAVDRRDLSDAERAELDAALAADPVALELAFAVSAHRERLDVLASPGAAARPEHAWRAPAELPTLRRRRRRPLAILAAAIMLAGALLFVASRRLRHHEDRSGSGAVPPVVPEQGATRPEQADRVLATFHADTAMIDLLGIDVPAAVERADAFAMSIFWRVRTPFPEDPSPDERWRVFVHMEPAADPIRGGGHRISADHDVNAPGTWWLTGDVVEDRFSVMAGHREYPFGTYDIYVGWFKGRDGAWTNASITGAAADEHGRLHVGRIELR